MKVCGFTVGLDQPLFLIAGPCVIESLQLQLDVAGRLKEITAALGIPFIFKSSFDKANRTSLHSYRGLGLEQGLQILDAVKTQIGRCAANTGFLGASNGFYSTCLRCG